MTGSGLIDSLDHVAVVSRRADALFDAYERMGFVLTPVSRHSGSIRPGEPPVPWGTGNRCAMFRSGYLELLAIIEPDMFCGMFPALLDKYEGLHIMAFGCDDAGAAETRLRDSGVGVQGIVSLQRELETPDGTGLARFSLVRLEPDEAPEARLNVIQHHTPELLWQPHLLSHPNRAVALVELVTCVADPDEAGARYARLLGVDRERRGAARILTLPRGRFVLVAPGDLAAVLPGITAPVVPFVAAFSVATEDLARTRRCLEEGGVGFEEWDGRVMVPREAGCGAVCIFEKT